MENLTEKLEENIRALKGVLASEDILVYTFRAGCGTDCAILYADGIVDKAVLGDLAARPLAEIGKKEGGRAALTEKAVRESLLFPEV